MRRDEQWQIEGDAAELYERYAARYILGPWAPAHLAATPIAREIRAAHRAARAALVDNVTRELARYAVADGIAFPEEINVLTARKGSS